MNVSDSLRDSSPLDCDVSKIRVRRIGGPGSSLLPHPYEGSLLQKLAPNLGPDPDKALYNQTDPHRPVEHEKAHHRIICILYAAGHAVKEIAEMVGYTPTTVSNIIRQPWAQRTITEELDRTKSSVLDVIERHAVAAAERLVEEMNNEHARPAERISAADKVLDRLLGKPNQPLTTFTGGRLEELTDAELVAIVRSGEAVTGPPQRT